MNIGDTRPPNASRSDRKESFEEWQARVFALDNAVREHLVPKGRQDWRYIEVPKMLAAWKRDRCPSSYLNLVARLMRMLELFAKHGTMSVTVVHAQLRACETFLGRQRPKLGREQTLELSARRAAQRVAQLKSGRDRAA